MSHIVCAINLSTSGGGYEDGWGKCRSGERGSVTGEDGLGSYIGLFLNLKKINQGTFTSSCSISTSLKL